MDSVTLRMPRNNAAQTVTRFNFTLEVPGLNPDHNTQSLPFTSTNIFLRTAFH